MAAAGKSAVRRLLPLLDRVLVEKVVAPTKSLGGVLLPESSAASKINEGVVVAVGPGGRTSEGKTIPMGVKEGSRVLLPDYGGHKVKLGDKEFLLLRDEEILGVFSD